jgi:invasion protein IalB
VTDVAIAPWYLPLLVRGDLWPMLRPRQFFVALMLASTLGIDGKVIAKQQFDSLGSAKKGMHSPANPRLAQLTATASAAQLPNGASSISEIYGDWAVDCRLADGRKQCRVIQIQNNSQTNQRLLEVEFRIPEDGRMDGTILLPFGLKLDPGARLKLDDETLGGGLRFLTCVPAGCLLPVSFSMTGVDAMKNGKILTVTSLNLTNEIIAFNVPLDGFAAAIARVIELGGWKPSKPAM